MNRSKLFVQILLLISAVSLSAFLFRTPIATAQVAGTTIAVKTSSSEVYVGDYFTVSGLLSTQTGVMIPNVNVTISWAHSIENVLTDEFGGFRASIAFPAGFPPGPSNITAMYVRSKYSPYQSSLKSVQVTVLYHASTISVQISPPSPKPSAQEQLTGRLVAERNEPITNRTVAILLDGQVVGTARTDEVGSFVFSFTVPSNLQGGSHQMIVAFNPGVDLYLPSNVTIVFSVAPAPVQETETIQTIQTIQQLTKTSSSVREKTLFPLTLFPITSPTILSLTALICILAVASVIRRRARGGEQQSTVLEVRRGPVPLGRRRTKVMDMLGYSMGAMRERKLRAILTIAMVMMGAGMMVGLNGLTTGADRYVNGQFQSLGANVIIVWGEALPPTNKTVTAIGKIADVRVTIPFVMQPATFQSAGASDSIIVIGENQQYLTQVYPSLRVAEGNFVAPNDSSGVVLGRSLAYPSNSSIPVTHVGSYVNISCTGSEGQTVTRRFIVRGILAEMGSVLAYSGAYSVDGMAFISLPEAISFFEWPSNSYTGVNVIATGPEQAETIAASIRQTYGNSFDVDTLKSIIAVIHNITDAFSVLTAAIASVSLVVASVGIFTGLFTSVTERTKEIGLLKAIGFKRRGIIGVFLGEAMLVGTIGGILGDALGVALGYTMAYLAGAITTSIYTYAGENLSYLPPAFTPENFLFVFAFSVVISMLAGAYPAWRASRLDPVVALRKE